MFWFFLFFLFFCKNAFSKQEKSEEHVSKSYLFKKIGLSLGSGYTVYKIFKTISTKYPSKYPSYKIFHYQKTLGTSAGILTFYLSKNIFNKNKKNVLENKKKSNNDNEALENIEKKYNEKEANFLSLLKSNLSEESYFNLKYFFNYGNFFNYANEPNATVFKEIISFTENILKGEFQKEFFKRINFFKKENDSSQNKQNTFSEYLKNFIEENIDTIKKFEFLKEKIEQNEKISKYDILDFENQYMPIIKKIDEKKSSLENSSELEKVKELNLYNLISESSEAQYILLLSMRNNKEEEEEEKNNLIQLFKDIINKEEEEEEEPQSFKNFIDKLTERLSNKENPNEIDNFFHILMNKDLKEKTKNFTTMIKNKDECSLSKWILFYLQRGSFNYEGELLLKKENRWKFFKDTINELIKEKLINLSYLEKILNNQFSNEEKNNDENKLIEKINTMNKTITETIIFTSWREGLDHTDLSCKYFEKLKNIQKSISYYAELLLFFKNNNLQDEHIKNILFLNEIMFIPKYQNNKMFAFTSFFDEIENLWNYSLIFPNNNLIKEKISEKTKTLKEKKIKININNYLKLQELQNKIKIIDPTNKNIEEILKDKETVITDTIEKDLSKGAFNRARYDKEYQFHYGLPENDIRRNFLTQWYIKIQTFNPEDEKCYDCLIYILTYTLKHQKILNIDDSDLNNFIESKAIIVFHNILQKYKNYDPYDKTTLFEIVQDFPSNTSLNQKSKEALDSFKKSIIDYYNEE